MGLKNAMGKWRSILFGGPMTATTSIFGNKKRKTPKKGKPRKKK